MAVRKVSKKLKKVIKRNDYSELLRIIPEGEYCYNQSGNCPFSDIDTDQEDQLDGYCHFLKEGDWGDDGYGLLWDQCKACGIGNTESQMFKSFALSLDISEEMFYNWLKRPIDILRNLKHIGIPAHNNKIIDDKRPIDLLENDDYDPLWRRMNNKPQHIPAHKAFPMHCDCCGVKIEAFPDIWGQWSGLDLNILHYLEEISAREMGLKSHALTRMGALITFKENCLEKHG